MMTTGDLLDQTASWTFPKSASAVSPFSLFHDVGIITFAAARPLSSFNRQTAAEQRYSSQPRLYLLSIIYQIFSLMSIDCAAFFKNYRYFIKYNLFSTLTER